MPIDLEGSGESSPKDSPLNNPEIFDDIDVGGETAPIVPQDGSSTDEESSGTASSTSSSQKFVFDIVNEESSDPIAGFGVSRYVEVFGVSVGDQIDQKIEECEVICSANSVDGTFEFNSDIDKYTLLEIDIRNTQFTNTSLPHWVVEDTMEWVNSGLPSHLSQVQHSNIVNVGIVHERNFVGLQKQISTPIQSKYCAPISVDWYDVFNSTIDYPIYLDLGNKNISLPYASCIFSFEDRGEIWVGGIGGVIKIFTADKSIESVIIDSKRDIDVQSIMRSGTSVFVLSKKDLYVYDLNTNKSTKDTGLGLPSDLYSFSISLSGVYIIGGFDGIYAKKPTQDEWTKVFSSDRVNIIASPDASFAIAGQEVLYSTDGFSWASLGNLSEDFIVNKIEKHRSQLLLGTTAGVYEDNGSFYGSSVSIRLIDILGDINMSAEICANDVNSNFDKVLIGLSDGRYIVYDTDYNVFDDSELLTIHKVLLFENDIWLFGNDQFRVIGDSKIRKLASGLTLGIAD